MSDHKNARPMLAKDGLTVSHLRQQVDILQRTQTTAHIREKLDSQATPPAAPITPQNVASAPAAPSGAAPKPE
jgi:hypothetical protein